MQKPKLFHIVLLLIVMTAIHFTAVSAGLYEQSVIWIDKVLHVMAGVAIAMSWLWIVRRVLKTSLENVPTIIAISSIVGFVLFIALFWEIFEFAYWKGAQEWANKFKFYSPTIVDVLSDIGSNLIGAIIFSMLATKKDKNDLSKT